MLQNWQLQIEVRKSMVNKTHKLYSLDKLTAFNAFNHVIRNKNPLRFQFLEEQHFVNEAVKFPVALLENAKLTIIHEIFVTMHLRNRNSPSAYQTHFWAEWHETWIRRSWMLIFVGLTFSEYGKLTDSNKHSYFYFLMNSIVFNQEACLV